MFFWLCPCEATSGQAFPKGYINRCNALSISIGSPRGLPIQQTEMMSKHNCSRNLQMSHWYQIIYGNRIYSNSLYNAIVLYLSIYIAHLTARAFQQQSRLQH